MVKDQTLHNATQSANNTLANRLHELGTHVHVQHVHEHLLHMCMNMYTCALIFLSGQNPP